MSSESPDSLLSRLAHGARLLVIRLRSIGDIVLMTPALEMLKAWRPDLRVSVIVEARFAELLEGHPSVDEALTLDRAPGGRGILAKASLIAALRRRKFAVAINLHGGPTSAWLAAASGAPVRVAFEHFRHIRLYHVRIPDARVVLGREQFHTAEHQACAFFALGMPRGTPPPASLRVSERAAAWWRSERARLGVEDDYAALHPAALYATKQWSPEHFAQLGEWLDRERGLAPVFAAGPGEEAVLDAVERAAKHSIRRISSVTLGPLAAILEGARVFVGNDSGPAHMARALKRPVVVIFGSSNSTLWGPWPPGLHDPPARTVQNFFPCNPCPGDRCREYPQPECILSVRFEQAQQAVDEVLHHSTIG